MLDAIGRGDALDGVRLASDALDRGASPVELIVDVMAPLLGGIDSTLGGGGPQAVTRSRQAVSTLERVFWFVVDHAGNGSGPAPEAKGTVIVGAPPGEWHEFVCRLVAEVLVLDGFDAVNLGASVPIDDFCAEVERTTDLVAVGVSVAQRSLTENARELIAGVRATLGDRAVVVAAGGPALLDLASAKAIGADAWAPDARGFALLLDARLGTRPHRAMVARATL
jgi:methanogenic corrinoid protein MtbC1